MRRIAWLVPRILALLRSVAPRRRHEQVFLVDELVARVVGCGVVAGVHSNGVAGTCFDAEAAEDAAELVDHALIGEALVAPALVALLVLGGNDVDALRRT